MKTIAHLMILLSLSNFAVVAQETVELEYNSNEKEIFWIQRRSTHNGKLTKEYKADKFHWISQRSILEYSEHFVSTKKIDALYASHHYRWFGVVDTAGIIKIPCIYWSLSEVRSQKEKVPFLYRFTIGDSMGIVEVGGRELFRVPRSHLQQKTRIDYEPNLDHFVIAIGENKEIYSRSEGKFIVPIFVNDETINSEQVLAKLSPTTETNKSFIKYTDSNKYRAVNRSDLSISEPYDELYILPGHNYFAIKDGQMLIKDSIGENALSPEYAIIEYGGVETYDNTVRDVYDNYDLLETFIVPVNHIIVHKDGKYGVLSDSLEVLIPCEYEDIYFIDDIYVWVKKYNRWAISTVEHEIMTGFEFIDIDQRNQTAYENFLHFLELDTSELTVEMVPSTLQGSYFSTLQESNSFALRIPKLRPSRIIHRYREHFALKGDGYHAIKFDRYTVRVDDEVSDETFNPPARMDERLSEFKRAIWLR